MENQKLSKQNQENLQVTKDFRDCGSCTECCKNLYIESVYGHEVKPGNPCFFLCTEKKCTIHENRPDVCRSFQCAWSQRLLPEWMKPDQSNALVCVENWGEHKQYQMLKVLSVNEGYDVRTFSWILDFCMKNKTPLAYEVPGSKGEVRYLGDNEFMDYIQKNKTKLHD